MSEITFSIDTAELRKGLALVKPVLGKGYNLPVLNHVRLEVAGGFVTISATDLEMGASYVIGMAGDTAVSIVHGKSLADAIPTGKGKTAFTMGDDGSVTACTAGITSSLPTMPAEEWPRLSARPEVAGQVAVAPFADVIPAVGDDRARPILCQVSMSGRELAATDSYRLHVAQRPADELELTGLVDQRLIKLTLKAAKAAKVDTFGIGIDDDHVLTTAGAFTAWHAVQQGEFPPYANLIPAEMPLRIDLSTAGPILAAAVKALPANERLLVRITLNAAVRVHAEREGMTIVDQSLPIGQSTAGQEFTVAYNPRYLSAAFDGSDRVLEVTDALKPALFRDDRGGIRLVMPVRVS